MKIVDKIFGTHSERELKRIAPLADKIDELRPAMQALSDEELKAKTDEYKKRLGRARPWTICSRKHLRRCVRRQSAF